MSAKAPSPGFLDLPREIRDSIYNYLLQPLSEEEVTTINYRLHWPYLIRPNNALPDLCVCPRESLRKRRTLGHTYRQPKQHVYTRYKCSGPLVHFGSIHLESKTLFLLDKMCGVVNSLRPATASELECRPSSAILQVSKQLYEEACPFLYRGRKFMFLTGPSSRGRYQAYATLHWLKQLGSIARVNVEVLSLLVQAYEEDVVMRHAEKSYAELGGYIHEQLPRFRLLYLEVFNKTVYQTVRTFLQVLDREAVGIEVRQTWRGDSSKVFTTKEGFSHSFDVIE